MNINPYHVRDGKWGGFGPPTWFAGIDPENPKNVFEIKRKHDSFSGTVENFYFRVWDFEKSVWRDLTDDEKILFTIPVRHVNIPKFDKIKIPSFKNPTVFPNISECFKS